MGSRSRSSSNSATTTNARQYTATDDAIIGNGNSRSEFIDASIDNSVQLSDSSQRTDNSMNSFVDNSDNSVHVENLSDDVAITAIAASAQLSRDLIAQANRRADSVSAAAERRTVENTAQLTNFLEDQNAATGAFVGEIITTATEEIGFANKGAAETVAAAAADNQQLLIYGAAGAAALVVATLVLRK